MNKDIQSMCFGTRLYFSPAILSPAQPSTEAIGRHLTFWCLFFLVNKMRLKIKPTSEAERNLSPVSGIHWVLGSYCCYLLSGNILEKELKQSQAPLATVGRDVCLFSVRKGSLPIPLVSQLLPAFFTTFLQSHRRFFMGLIPILWVVPDIWRHSTWSHPYLLALWDTILAKHLLHRGIREACNICFRSHAHAQPLEAWMNHMELGLSSIRQWA